MRQVGRHSKIPLPRSNSTSSTLAPRQSLAGSAARPPNGLLGRDAAAALQGGGAACLQAAALLLLAHSRRHAELVSRLRLSRRCVQLGGWGRLQTILIGPNCARSGLALAAVISLCATNGLLQGMWVVRSAWSRLAGGLWERRRVAAAGDREGQIPDGGPTAAVGVRRACLAEGTAHGCAPACAGAALRGLRRQGRHAAVKVGCWGRGQRGACTGNDPRSSWTGCKGVRDAWGEQKSVAATLVSSQLPGGQSSRNLPQ